MKRILIGIMILAVGGIGVWYYVVSQPEKYDKPKVITNTVTKEVDALDAEIEDAINASSTEIHNVAQEAYDATVQRLEKETELRVRRGQKEVIDDKIIELEKEVNVY